MLALAFAVLFAVHWTETDEGFGTFDDFSFASFESAQSDPASEVSNSRSTLCAATPTETAADAPGHSKGLSARAIAGIAVGVILVVAIVCVVVTLIARHRKNESADNTTTTSMTTEALSI